MKTIVCSIQCAGKEEINHRILLNGSNDQLILQRLLRLCIGNMNNMPTVQSRREAVETEKD